MSSRFVLAGLVSVAVFVAVPLSSFAQTSSQAVGGQKKKSRRSEQRAFRLGVCVGQNLAAAGIDIASLEAAKTSVDETTRAALKAAIESCREASTVSQPAPQPVPQEAPTEVPQAVPADGVIEESQN